MIVQRGIHGRKLDWPRLCHVGERSAPASLTAGAQAAWGAEGSTAGPDKRHPERSQTGLSTK